MPKPLALASTDMPFEATKHEEFYTRGIAPDNPWDATPMTPIYPEDEENEYYPNPFYPVTDETYTAYAITCFSVLIFVIGVVGNVAVMYIVCHNYYTRSISNALLANLAVWDLGVLSLCMPLVVFHELTKTYLLGHFTCKVIPYIEEHVQRADLTCQKTVYNLVDMERKNDPLPISTVGSRGKGPKRDEQYRIMWNELETLVKMHVKTSERHQQVLECISACRSKPQEEEEEERKKRGRKREDKDDKTEKNGKDKESEEKGWTQETDRLKGTAERVKENESESGVVKDSPDSPEPFNKKPRLMLEDLQPQEKTKGPVSLLSLWTSRIAQANSRNHPEFAGRLNSISNKAELYQHLKEENGKDVHENGKTTR